MTLRALVVGFVIATSEPVYRLFEPEHPKTVVQFIQDVECPPCFYIRIDEQVFEVML